MKFQKRIGDTVFTSDGFPLDKCVVEVNDMITLKTKTEFVKVKVFIIDGDKYTGGIGGSGVETDLLELDSVRFFYDEINFCHKS